MTDPDAKKESFILYLNVMTIFQQRDFGDKINATFTYIGQQFRGLGTALVYIGGPIAILAGISSGIYQSNILKITTSPSAANDPFAALSTVFGPAYLLTLVFTVLGSVMVGLTTCSYLKLYQQRNEQPVAVADVWTEVQRHIGRTLLFTLASIVVMITGFVLLFIPGVYIAIVLSLAMPIIVFEDADFGTTWNRCFQLIRDKWWSTFGLMVVMLIVVSIINLVFAIPAGIVQALVSMKVVPNMPSLVTILTNALNMIGATLLYSLLYLALCFQYANLVERQEGTGLASAIDSIGAPTTKPNTLDEGDF